MTIYRNQANLLKITERVFSLIATEGDDSWHVLAADPVLSAPDPPCSARTATPVRTGALARVTLQGDEVPEGRGLPGRKPTLRSRAGVIQTQGRSG